MTKQDDDTAARMVRDRMTREHARRMQEEFIKSQLPPTRPQEGIIPTKVYEDRAWKRYIDSRKPLI